MYHGNQVFGNGKPQGRQEKRGGALDDNSICSVKLKLQLQLPAEIQREGALQRRLDHFPDCRIEIACLGDLFNAFFEPVRFQRLQWAVQKTHRIAGKGCIRKKALMQVLLVIDPLPFPGNLLHTF